MNCLNCSKRVNATLHAIRWAWYIYLLLYIHILRVLLIVILSILSLHCTCTGVEMTTLSAVSRTSAPAIRYKARRSGDHGGWYMSWRVEWYLNACNIRFIIIVIVIINILFLCHTLIVAENYDGCSARKVNDWQCWDTANERRRSYGRWGVWSASATAKI